MTILRNAFLSELRRRKARPSPAGLDEASRMPEEPVFPRLRDEAEDSEEAFFGRLIDREVLEAIESLEAEFRVPFVLSGLEGTSYRELADVRDVPVGTVKSRPFRARRRLQKRLYGYARDMGYIR